MTGNAKRFLKVAEKVNLRSKEFDFSLFLDSIVYFLLSGSKNQLFGALEHWYLVCQKLYFLEYSLPFHNKKSSRQSNSKNGIM